MRKYASYLIRFAFLLSGIFYLAPDAKAQTWTMDRYNPSRTNQGSLIGPRNLSNFVMINNSINGSLIRSSPDGSIITWNPLIGSTGFGQIHRYLRDGSVSWDSSIATDGFGLKDIAVNQDGTIYVISMGQVVALNKSTGSPTWAFQGGSDQSSPLAIGRQGTIYFHSGASLAGGSEAITAIAPDGSPLWQAIGTFRGDSRMVFSTDESTVYLLNTKSLFGSPIGNVTAYSTVDGHKISDTPCDPRGMLFAYAPWDVLYSFATDGAFFLGLTPDLSSCALVSANGLSTVDMAATTRQGRILVQTLSSIAIMDQSSNILFNSNEPLVNGFVDSAGVLFAENPQTNEIVAIDTISLSQLWRSSIKDPITGFSLGSDGNLYVSAGTALLRSAPVQQPVWPMTGHDPQRTGLSTFAGPTAPPSGPSWTFTSGGPVIGDLAVSAEGKIYFSSDKLYALNPDGTTYAPAVAIAPLTAPAIDDLNGFVYVIAVSDSRNYDVLRYSKQLQNPVVVYQGVFSFSTPTSMTVGPDGTVYFSDGVSLIAVGPHSWRTQDRPCFVGFLAPTLGRDGSVYSMCTSGGGAGFGSGIYRYDGDTGVPIISTGYSRGGTELIIDAQNDIRAGFQAFDGGTFGGAYDAWDANLIKLTPGNNGDFTTSRSALFPDGLSTVRIGFSFQPNILEASGAHTWGVISGPQTLPAFSTPPTVDAAGNVYIGTVSGVAALNGTDGHIIWFSPSPDTIATQPTISSDGTLLVGSTGGNIYAFNLKTAIVTGTISVNTNIAATFTINGPVTFSAIGPSFTKADLPAGIYTINYNAVPGFITPDSETKVLTPGDTIVFSHVYTALPPILTVTISKFDFGSQVIGTHSIAKNIQLLNTGGGILIPQITIAGDYLESDNCSDGLAASATCQVAVTFAPQGPAMRSGQASISNGNDLHKVELAGFGAIGFPLKGSTAGVDLHWNPGTALLNSVFDHSMQDSNGYHIYGCDKQVIDFLHEIGDKTSDVLSGCHAGYSQPKDQIFEVNGNYSGGKFLYYDGHPGIDYQSSFGNQVYAVISGTLKYPTLSELGAGHITIGGDPDNFNVLELDAPDGLKIFYLHLSSHPRSIAVHLTSSLENQNFIGKSDGRFSTDVKISGNSNHGGKLSISGKITFVATPSAPTHVAVQLLGKTVGTKTNPSGCVSAVVEADGAGNYSFTGLPEGFYNVRPIKSGFMFSSDAHHVIADEGAITAGDQIAESGNAGVCLPPHLHFEVQRPTTIPIKDHVTVKIIPTLNFIPVDPYGWHPCTAGAADPYFLIPDLAAAGLTNETLWVAPPDASKLCAAH